MHTAVWILKKVVPQEAAELGDIKLFMICKVGEFMVTDAFSLIFIFCSSSLFGEIQFGFQIQPWIINAVSGIFFLLCVRQKQKLKGKKI